MEKARDEYASLDKTLELASEVVRARSRAFDEGLGTSLEVVDAQLAVQGVKLQRLAAAYDYDVALAELLEATGDADRFDSLRAQADVDPRNEHQVTRPNRIPSCIVGRARRRRRRGHLGVRPHLAEVAQPAPEIVQGQIEATEIDVSSKIPGRLDGISVVEGASVGKGDLVATLDSPEIEAKLAQATAAKAAASAQRDKADHGAREEEIRAAEATWLRARRPPPWPRRRSTVSIAWRETAWRRPAPRRGGNRLEDGARRGERPRRP